MTAFISGAIPMESQDATQIAPLSHREAGEQARTELGRLLTVIESLAGNDWEQPTYCTLWNVKDMVAHIAGACAMFAGWSEFKRQTVGNPYRNTEPMAVDGLNRLQVEDRADRTPQELVAELREAGPQAIRTRQRIPWALRKLPVPFGPPLGTKPVEYLTDVIYTRDWWMHRYDLCAATGKEMALSAEHDGRLIALVVRDLALRLRKTAGAPSVLFVLTGPAGGVYRLGPVGDPVATLTLDPPTFALLASERITPEQALAATGIDGDRDAATWLLNNATIPF